MNEIAIQQASIQELDILVEWRMKVMKEVFPLFSKTDIPTLVQANRRYYQDALLRGGHIACLARYKDNIAGCGGVCLYNEMPSPDNPSGQCAYLMNIYVHPEYRHLHIGRSIVRWLIGQAREKGITKIFLETTANGRNMYQAAGFSKMQDMMFFNTKNKQE